MKTSITAGALVRRGLRRYLMLEGIEFIEEKGLFDSEFFLKVSDTQYKNLQRLIDEVSHE